MHTQVHWVSVDDTVNQAQTKMQEIGVSYLLVGDGSRLEGIVTRSDLASAASIYLRPIFSKWRRPEDDATLQIRLKWIMSKQIYSVKPETPIDNVAHLTCKYDISCLPVVDVQGQVLGVVTTKDVFKGFVNKDLNAMGVAVA
jgi:acetoin utilization protein AcuB